MCLKSSELADHLFLHCPTTLEVIQQKQGHNEVHQKYTKSAYKNNKKEPRNNQSGITKDTSLPY